MATFQQRLIEAMEAKDISAAELSRLSGVNEGAISQYRKGAYKAGQRTLDKLAAVLNVSPGWLMGEPEQEEEQPEYYFNKETAALAQQIHDDPDLRVLMDASRKLSPDELRAVIAIIKTMKGI